MRRRPRSLDAAPPVARGLAVRASFLACASLLAGASFLACASFRDQPPLEYAFSHPFFNEPYGMSAEVATTPRERIDEPARSAPAPPSAPRDGEASAPADEARAPADEPPLPPAALRAAGPSATTAAAPMIGAPSSGAHADRRAETLDAAIRLLGMRDAFDPRGFLHHLLSVGDIRLSGLDAEPTIRDVYRALRAQQLTYDRSTPQPGDLVFFHNTEDTNGDGRQNDWYSLVGVVEAVEEGGTVTLILPVEGEVARRAMNLERPEVRRMEASGAILNDVLRQKRLDDPAYTQYLAGELYAGFAALPE